MEKLHNASDFVKCAVEGGYIFRGQYPVFRCTIDDARWPDLITLDLGSADNQTGVVCTVIHELLTDPLAWAAVGKVRGWKREDCDICKTEPSICSHHQFSISEERAIDWFSNRLLGCDEIRFWESLP